MSRYEYILTSDGELYHHGIKGQKWGRRRYQNPDGTWTNAGKERYGDDIPDGKSESSSGEGKKTSRGLAIAKTAARAAAGVLKNPTSKHENNGGINSLSDKLRPRSTKDKNDGGVNSLDERLRPTVMSAKGAKDAQKTDTANDKQIAARRESARKLANYDFDTDKELEKLGDLFDKGRIPYSIYSIKASALDRKRDREWDKLKDDLFLTKELKPEFRKAKALRKQMDSTFAETVGPKSKAYKDALEKYKKDRPDLDDAEYGFDHYYWPKSEERKQVMSSYKSKNAALRKEYDGIVSNISKKVTEGYGDQPVSKDRKETYEEWANGEVRDILTFREYEGRF